MAAWGGNGDTVSRIEAPIAGDASGGTGTQAPEARGKCPVLVLV